jgi:hypothetical protein
LEKSWMRLAEAQVGHPEILESSSRVKTRYFFDANTLVSRPIDARSRYRQAFRRALERGRVLFVSVYHRGALIEKEEDGGREVGGSRGLPQPGGLVITDTKKPASPALIRAWAGPEIVIERSAR